MKLISQAEGVLREYFNSTMTKINTINRSAVLFNLSENSIKQFLGYFLSRINSFKPINTSGTVDTCVKKVSSVMRCTEVFVIPRIYFRLLAFMQVV